MFINHNCINYPAPEGAFGGAMCMCERCVEERKPPKEKTAIEIMQDGQLDEPED